MGTRGLGVVRFRKRYYIFHNTYDSYPDGLGKRIAKWIPTDAAEYQEWHGMQRKTAEEWEALYEEYFSIKPGNEFMINLPAFIPSSLAPLNDTWIEWIYTVDLDRETFSVNNGAHFKLDRVPHVGWINSLADGGLGDKIILPGAVPMEAVTNLVIERTDQSCDLSKTLGDLTTPTPIHQIVVPKDVRDIPWRQRHGPILRMFTFYLWSCANEDQLAGSLLQLNPEDLPFREIAFAALSLAAGGKNLKIVSSKDVRTNGEFCFILEEREGSVYGEPEYNADSEFVSFLASGAHLQGSPPGSSPDATIYWLEDVLVVLTTHLCHAFV